MHAILAIFAMVGRPTEDDNFAAYRARFGVPDDAATFGNFLVDMAAATKLQDIGSNMTCSVCYNIHGGVSGAGVAGVAADADLRRCSSASSSMNAAFQRISSFVKAGP